MIDFQLPGESSAAYKWPSLQALPGALGLRSGRAASGAAATVKCTERWRHPPAYGRAAPGPAPFARPRPSKACSPFHSSVFLCLSGASAGRSATVRHPEHLQPDATASLAPQLAAQSPFYHLPPFRRAPPSLAVSDRPSLRTSVPPVPAKADPWSADLRPAQARPLGTPPPGKFRETNILLQQRLRRRYGFLWCAGGCRCRFLAVLASWK